VLCGGTSRFSDPGGYESRRATLSSMSLGVSRLLMQLTENLITKSRAYKADPLAHLFLMNNVHYVQWSVEGSPAALALMGSEWLERHKDLVEEYGAKYHEGVWMPLVRLLQVRGWAEGREAGGGEQHKG
jgi:exocyst complex protein 7